MHPSWNSSMRNRILTTAHFARFGHSGVGVPMVFNQDHTAVHFKKVSVHQLL